MNITEANDVNVLLHALYVIESPYRETGNGPTKETVRLAAHAMAVRADKVLHAGVHPSDIQKAERRHYPQ